MSSRYRGASASERVAERRSRLVAAGIDLVGAEGAAALGMRAVCRRAELSQRFFYESFANVEALLHATYDAALEQLDAAVAEPMAAGDLAGVVEAMAVTMEGDPRLCRILLIEPIADLRLRRHVRRTAPETFVVALGRWVEGTSEDGRVRVRTSAVLGAVISLFIEWTEGTFGTDRDAFVRHVTEVILDLLDLDAVPPDVIGVP